MTSPPFGASDGVCVRCGTALVPATSFLSEVGAVCWPCSEALQTERQRQRTDVDGRERALDARARRAGVVHGVMWGTVALVLAQILPAWAARSMMALAVTLAIALFLRKRWAYPAALGIDAAGTVMIVVLGVASSAPLWRWLLAALFSLSLVALTRTAREAYGRHEATDGAVGRAKFVVPRWLLVVVAAAIVVAGIAVGVAWSWAVPNPW